MLKNCPECSQNVSDKAVSCPHCGYPLKINVKTAARKSNRRQRLPNGFGSITKIKNKNLRNPWRVMVPAGKSETGRPLSKLLKPQSYFPTYNDAYAALIDYHRNPYDLKEDITVSELYEKWSAEYLKNIVCKNTYTGAWKYCASVYDMKVRDVRMRHIKACIENGTRIIGGQEHHPSDNIKSNMKLLFNLMFDYAVEYEIAEKNYARNLKTAQKPKKVQKEHISFSNEEMSTLWNHIDTTENVDIMLIQCYSGWRPQELINLKIENVDLNKRTFSGGMKTEYGRNRIVPIHSKIYKFVKKRYDKAQKLNSEYLFLDSKNEKFTQTSFRHCYDKIVEELDLNPNHRPHDPRKHFVTMAKKYQMDEYAIKYIAGHSISDITEKIYTERETSWLIEEMKKIK